MLSCLFPFLVLFFFLRSVLVLALLLFACFYSGWKTITAAFDLAESRFSSRTNRFPGQNPYKQETVRISEPIRFKILEYTAVSLDLPTETDLPLLGTVVSDQKGKYMRLRLKYNSPVILTFALLCLGVLIISELTGYRYMDWLITRRAPLNQIQTYVTMVTYILGHASVNHFMSNMMLLLLTGPVVEERYGSKNTLIIILFTAILTAIANMAVTTNGLIGCSGVVFAFIILCSMTSFRHGEIPVTMILVVILYLGQEIIAGVISTDNISQMAHVIGGIAGASFGFILAYRKR